MFDNKKAQLEKRNMVCDYYKKKGHVKETCFKLHMVHDWLKEIPGRKASFGTNSDTDLVARSSVGGGHQMVPNFDINSYRDEVKKLISSTS